MSDHLNYIIGRNLTTKQNEVITKKWQDMVMNEMIIGTTENGGSVLYRNEFFTPRSIDDNRYDMKQFQPLKLVS